MSPMTLITPSVGRKVWYYFNEQQAQPWDATVIKVHDLAGEATPHSPVNLVVLHPDTGAPIFRPFIAFHDASEQFPGEHFQWMPVQVAQAAKAAADAVATPETAQA